MKKNIIITILVLVVLFLSFYIWRKPQAEAPTVNQAPIEEKQKAEINDLIIVDNPVIGQIISSPVTITGRARGYWMFEADFPVVIVDWDGLIIGQGVAIGEGDWMTEDFVPFKAVVEFDTSKISGNYSNKGSIILQKSNPSGLPEYDNALEFPILFSL